MRLRAGVYSDPVVVRSGGTPGHRLRIVGEPGAMLRGGGGGRQMQLMADHVWIEGIEFASADILLWLQEADDSVIRGNHFHHAEGECIRMKYQSTKNLIEDNDIHDCGLGDFVRGGGGKNGEGVYIGTAPEQLYKNPTREVDKSDHNVVRRNRFDTNGNECVDIKEGSSFNLISENDCTGQRDPESGGFDSRGNDNEFVDNVVYGNKGAGIRFGGDTSSDGLGNSAVRNVIRDNVGPALKVQRLPQGRVCGNVSTRNGGGLSNNSAITNPPC